MPKQPFEKPLPPELTQVIQNLFDILKGEGAHADHTQVQRGRCVFCSCGQRAQGKLERK